MTRAAWIPIALATVLAAWLRLHGLDIQVVQDDEWHAIHKLLSSSYGEIFRSFGIADHSIPLTLFYKALAGTVGLDEIDMRIVQAACGIALVAAAGGLAWRATADAALAGLFAFLVAGAPFLVLYSRFARPYAITTLLTLLGLAALWRWRFHRSAGLALAICAVASLSAWLHPLTALYPMAALFFILLEDLQKSRWTLRSARAVVLLGIAVGASIAAPLAVPFANDLGSLAEKAGHSPPTAYTLSRMVSLFAGGLPDAVTAGVGLIAAWGAWCGVRPRRQTPGSDPGVDAYVVLVGLAPLLAVIALRGSWSHQGHTLARYVLPTMLAFLYCFSVGAMDLVRRIPANRAVVEGFAAFALVAAYLALNPALEQVRTLGPWYGHLYHHFDYIPADNRALRYYDGWTVPAFYRRLGEEPAGSLLIIQAPFKFDAPFNPDAFYAPIHRQRELQGFVHDLCLSGPRYGEVPRDARFRFRSFVFLDDRTAVLATGARYLVFQRDLMHGQPFKAAGTCLEALRARYGEPVVLEPRLAVFDLQRPGGLRTLQ